jgi:DNA uptake protein ComE-like DNA-binding protein
LARIVGIGDECAQRIIRYRIRDVEGLADELKGFGDQAMRHLREQATV